MNEVIFNQVATIIAEQFNEPVENLTPQTRFKEDLHADSISIVELIMAFEEAFGGTIEDEQAEKLQTIGDAVAYIESAQA
ncbi:acyl carrier protein [Carnobacteriaceae bacterium zg-ZUI252]|nr:acyl carrier protein [Carnobacteriaceae bacterium zg-ZUI252]MBS4769831.1 acyl carrier protein [Carnobacteriaceae bacterium zg-ZUI240]